MEVTESNLRRNALFAILVLDRGKKMKRDGTLCEFI